MITDNIKYLSQYPELKKYETEILGFIERCACELPAPGRYELQGEDLFALLQAYETKDYEACRPESHKKYADLQYIVKGAEWIMYAPVDELTVSKDKTPNEDIIFYEKAERKSGNLLTAGMFGYYAPQDAHTPCVTATQGRAEEAIKIVFKIKVA